MESLMRVSVLGLLFIVVLPQNVFAGALRRGTQAVSDTVSREPRVVLRYINRDAHVRHKGLMESALEHFSPWHFERVRGPPRAACLFDNSEENAATTLSCLQKAFPSCGLRRLGADQMPLCDHSYEAATYCTHVELTKQFQKASADLLIVLEDDLEWKVAKPFQLVSQFLKEFEGGWEHSPWDILRVDTWGGVEPTSRQTQFLSIPVLQQDSGAVFGAHFTVYKISSLSRVREAALDYGTAGMDDLFSGLGSSHSGSRKLNILLFQPSVVDKTMAHDHRCVRHEMSLPEDSVNK